MAGIYIHIPFCKQACHYCNFHFSTSLKYKEEMLKCILRELELRKDELAIPLTSIYFGGGTPSLLSPSEIESIVAKIAMHFDVANVQEVTLEVNPDDVTYEYLTEIQQSGINRLSVGIQSFSQEDLISMNRAHSSEEAHKVLEAIARANFKDFSLDLIYGGHTTTDETWNENVSHALQYSPTHISAYCLTIEEGTVFGHHLKKNRLTPVDQDKANRQYSYLQDRLEEAQFIHYEVSNFGLKNHFAVHNTNYWKGMPYLGIGPSAHSFNGLNRGWNVANNRHYLKALQEGELPLQLEELSDTDRYNEYIMTGLRTMWGVDAEMIKRAYGSDYATYFLESLNDSSWIIPYLKIDGSKVVLTKEGLNFADRIASHLFYID